MPLVKIIKEDVVAYDVEFGMDTVKQLRGEGEQINASHIPYTSSQSSAAAIQDRYTKSQADSMLKSGLSTKLDLAGGEIVGKVGYAPYPTRPNELATVKFVRDWSSGGGRLFDWQGRWDPSDGTVYPPIPPDSKGAPAWILSNENPFVIPFGQLAGQEALPNNIIAFTADGWIMTALDIGAGVYLRLDGLDPMQANLDMNAYNIQHIARAVDPTDAVRYDQLVEIIFDTHIGDLADVDTVGVVDGNVLIYDGILGIWKTTEGTPTTPTPRLSSMTVSLTQNDSTKVSILDYSDTAVYTIVGIDTNIATVTRSGNILTVVAADVNITSNTIASITCMEQGYLESSPVELAINVTYVPYIENAVVNGDFKYNELYIDGFTY